MTGFRIISGEFQQPTHVGLRHARTLESLLIGLYDIHEQDVIFQVAKALRCSAVDERCVEALLFAGFAARTDDANLSADVLGAE